MEVMEVGSRTVMSPRPLAALWLLLAACCRLSAAAPHGCLFEKNLCGNDQLCADDGLFGQCRPPHQDPVQYQVSLSLLYKMQQVLKDLMRLGLTWKDDITQEIIGQVLSGVPQDDSAPRLQEKSIKHRSPGGSSPGGSSLSQRRRQGPEEPSGRELMQQYLDYMVLDPSRPSVHMQAPLLDPSTFRQKQYDYQEEEQEEERSVNSLEESPAYLASPPRTRSRGTSLDRDQQLLQDLVSLYLSSSSSPAQPPSRHRGAVPGAFPSSLSSSSSFFPELDFPLDYGEDYVSQVAQIGRQHEEAQKKEQKESEALPGFHDKYINNAATGKKITEDAMVYKMIDPATFAIKSPKAGMSQKEANPGTESRSRQDSLGKKNPSAGAGTGLAKAKEYGYIITNHSAVGPALTFRVRPNSENVTAEDVAEKAVAEKNLLESGTALETLQSGAGQKGDVKALPLAARVQPSSRWGVAALVVMACIGSLLVVATTIACLRHHAHRLAAKKLGLGPEGGAFTHQEYQDLCRQHMASKGAFGRLEAAALGAVGGASGGGGGGAGVGGGAGGGGGGDSRVSSVSSQFSDAAQASPGSHSSTPSWCEEPAQANMDISTGHMILAYMEDHLRNKDRLMKEWEALCSYQAEPSAVSVAQSDANAKKNRCSDSAPYDHSRVKLKAELNPSRSDYINASTIIEHDPRMPAYIATQGPLSHTISDFWQMVWENGCTVIVMMTALVEDGEKQCDRYWPDEGSSLYHIYEVNLVSEHIWCNDFLVRSFYLKNVQTQETRTLTQFHFLSWPAQGIPTSTRPLLDFRRKVNKCYRGRSCPIIVHCSDGTGRTGTYILIDMVLNRMAKGVKEIDIAATLEHIRDQRPGMVRTKDQFEFALTAVAEEVNAILKALPQ
ncbi:receptor-type tyrosine-protein phosphatase-like N [Thalassophryne amazonica]|uniref:receptor-type tyrosine-protein phosphatase-like N n=1 Tax=Thalassophryne amazonica TaxID=390379 RepID=UPI0014720206|nr:receptor-type tyrosine-protein phosphatase-like N [Thalassophryne amazonica]